jgi:fructokinase
MIRIGVDFGGTKIEAAALDASGAFRARRRLFTPRDYDGCVAAVRDLVRAVEREAGVASASVGVGMPGSISPRDGLIRNANSTWLNGRPFEADLAQALARPVRLANDANCLALSEAVDGAGSGASVVFAAILGTGCGGGLAIDGRPIAGRNGITGEWGHTPLPWASGDEHPGPLCWCGRRGCLELWISGVALGADDGAGRTGQAVAEAALAGEPQAQRALDRYTDRLARALAVVCDIVDPDVIVLGGGMSNVESLYERLPSAIAPHVFSDVFDTPVRRAAHGDSSGVRGAAWLWPPDAAQ